MGNINKLKSKNKTDQNLVKLLDFAKNSGAVRAAIISAQDIKVQDELAKLCKEPKCENFGLSPSCPPYVSGPSGFRKIREKSKYAMVIKMDVPLETLLSDQDREIMRFLHEIVADIENKAVQMGFINSKAFAGGSCKTIFCRDYPDCLKLSKKGRCRNPDSARPSMSGFGINVSEMIKKAGWAAENLVRDKKTDADGMTWVAGLIMIG